MESASWTPSSSSSSASEEDISEALVSEILGVDGMTDDHEYWGATAEDFLQDGPRYYAPVACMSEISRALATMYKGTILDPMDAR
jgi:hypothetical protein